MKNLLYTLIIGILLLSSCAKETIHLDANGTDAGFSLNGTTWGATASTSYFFIGQEKFEYDLFLLVPACGKDDKITFNANGTITGDYGPLTCDPTQTGKINFGSWKLSADKKTLEVSSSFLSSTGTSMIKSEVLVMNDNNLQIRYKTTANGIESTTTTTYKRVK